MCSIIFMKNQGMELRYMIRTSARSGIENVREQLQNWARKGKGTLTPSGGDCLLKIKAMSSH